MFIREQDDFVFQPMTAADVPEALQIIAEHDEDDYEEAAETYARGLQGQFSLFKQGSLIGVTGANPIPGTDRSFGVSWTYLLRGMMGQGHGRFMLESLIDYLRQHDARKVFVNSSDYLDPERGDIYRDAHKAYRAVGFEEELRHAHYYQRGEALVSFGMRLLPHDTEVIPQNDAWIKLVDVDEIPECDGAFWLAWELTDEPGAAGDFQMIFDQVRQWNGRVIFMAFPSDLIHVNEFMTRSRFRLDGQLSDYFQDGVDEVHYRYDLL